MARTNFYFYFLGLNEAEFQTLLNATGHVIRSTVYMTLWKSLEKDNNNEVEENTIMKWLFD